LFFINILFKGKILLLFNFGIIFLPGCFFSGKWSLIGYWLLVISCHLVKRKYSTKKKIVILIENFNS